MRYSPLMNAFRIVLCLVFAISCKSKKDDASTKVAEPAAAVEDASPPLAPSDNTNTDSLPKPVGHVEEIAQAFAKAGLKLGPAALADWELETEEATFLGFSKDGLQYAILTSIGHPEEPGSAPFYVNFVEVRDIHTRKATSVFQGAPYKSKEWGNEARPDGKQERQAAKYWKTLPDLALADKHVVSLGIESVEVPELKTTLTGPEGQELSVEVVGKAPFKTKFKMKKVDDRYDFKWTGFEDDTSDGKRGRSPKIEVKLKVGAVSSVLLSLRSFFTYQDIFEAADEREPYLEGSIWAHWAHDGKRVNLIFDEQVHDIHEEYGYFGRNVQYLRAVGPQIKIVDAGVGDETARQAAVLLDKNGLYVTRVETSKEPSAGAVLYYRGEAGKSAMEAAKKLIPSATSEELEKDGWVDLIVVLGTVSASGEP